MNSDEISRLAKLRQQIAHSLQWLSPGLGVKRWLAVILAGTTLLGIGFGIFILEIYRGTPADAEPWWLLFLSQVSLRALARPVRVLIFGSIGLGLVLGGIWGLNRALLSPYVRPGRAVVDTLAGHRRRRESGR